MPNIAENTPAHRLLRAMTAIVGAPGYAYLQHFKDDFLQIDHSILLEDFELTSRYVWVVTMNGTHLTRIGIHPKQNSWAEATLDAGSQSSALGAKIYLLSAGGGVREVTRAQAITAMNEYQFKVNNGVVTDRRNDRAIAFKLTKFFDSKENRSCTAVQFQCENAGNLDLRTLLALRDIATQESIIAWHSFFCSVRDLTVNGQDWSALMAAKQAAAQEVSTAVKEIEDDVCSFA